MKILREGDFGKNTLSIATLSERMRVKIIIMRQKLNKLASWHRAFTVNIRCLSTPVSRTDDLAQESQALIPAC